MMKTTIRKIAVVVAAALFSLALGAQNPYMPLWEFIPDGEPYVFDDPDNPGHQRVYVYGSHDILEKFYCGRDQVVWSAPVENLAQWRCDGVIFESKYDADGNLLNPEGIGDVLYAPDVCEVKAADGSKKYYLYPNVQDRERNNLVAVADRPDGPFVPCNFSKDDPRKTEGPFGFDPAVLMDDDGRAYGYWGFGRSRACELDPATMSTVKPGTEIIEDMIPGFQSGDNTFRFYEASSIRKIKDKYVFVFSRSTAEGEEGLPSSNYTLAYCYSEHPLGPWTYGGTIIDGRGKELRPDGSYAITGVVNGNTHGSICRIGDRWWVFYHRQAGTCEYSRQAMVAPLRVDVKEGPGGYVHIKEAEFTSEGFAIEGLDPYKRYPAGIACYFTGPEPAHQEYPNVVYPGSHIGIFRGQYDGVGDPYAPQYNRCTMEHNTSGSVVGYKYFNFSGTYGKKGLTLSLNLTPGAVDGRIDVYIDRPSEDEGGVKIGSLAVKGDSRQPAATPVEKLISVSNLTHFNGKHALFFVFTSPTQGESICTLNDFCFVSR